MKLKPGFWRDQQPERLGKKNRELKGQQYHYGKKYLTVNSTDNKEKRSILNKL